MFFYGIYGIVCVLAYPWNVTFYPKLGHDGNSMAKKKTNRPYLNLCHTNYSTRFSLGNLTSDAEIYLETESTGYAGLTLGI